MSSLRVVKYTYTLEKNNVKITENSLVAELKQESLTKASEENYLNIFRQVV